MVGKVLVDQLVDPAAGRILYLGRDREGRVPAVHHRYMEALGGDAARQGPMGVDQIGLDPPDQLFEHLHIVPVVRAVRHAVHLVDLGARLFQGLL